MMCFQRRAPLAITHRHRAFGRVHYVGEQHGRQYSIDFGSGPEPCIPVSWGDVATAFHTTGIGNVTVYFRRSSLLRLANVAGTRPNLLEYEGAAEQLREIWVGVRAALRGVLEDTTLADVANKKLPAHVKKLVADQDAWEVRI